MRRHDSVDKVLSYGGGIRVISRVKPLVDVNLAPHEVRRGRLCDRSIPTRALNRINHENMGPSRSKRPMVREFSQQTPNREQC